MFPTRITILLFVLVLPLISCGNELLCPPYGSADCEDDDDDEGTGGSPPLTPCTALAQIYERTLVSGQGEHWPNGVPQGGWYWLTPGWAAEGSLPHAEAPASAYAGEPWRVQSFTGVPGDLECPGCPPATPSDAFVWALVTGPQPITGTVTLTTDGISVDYPLLATQVGSEGWWLMTADVSSRGEWEWPAQVTWEWPGNIVTIGRVGFEGELVSAAPLWDDLKQEGNAVQGFIPADGMCYLLELVVGADETAGPDAPVGSTG